MRRKKYRYLDTGKGGKQGFTPYSGYLSKDKKFTDFSDFLFHLFTHPFATKAEQKGKAA